MRAIDHDFCRASICLQHVKTSSLLYFREEDLEKLIETKTAKVMECKNR